MNVDVVTVSIMLAIIIMTCCYINVKIVNILPVAHRA